MRPLLCCLFCSIGCGSPAEEHIVETVRDAICECPAPVEPESTTISGEIPEVCGLYEIRDCTHVICYGHERYEKSPTLVTCIWPCTLKQSTGWERTTLRFEIGEDSCMELVEHRVDAADECAAPH